MTDFVPSYATEQLVPPWQSEGCETWCFVVEVGRANVTNYLANYLNGAYPDCAPYEYRPLPGRQFGLVTFAHHPKIISLAKGHAADSLEFNEVFWTFPVHRYQVGTDDLLLAEPSTVWLQPFSFCDNASVVFASREIWGRDMVMATIERPSVPGVGPLHVDVAIDGFRKFGPRSISEMLGCVHIETQDRRIANLDAFLRGDRELQAFSKLVAQFRDPAASRLPPPEINNLKQFRDIYRLCDATYRAIIASQAWHENVTELHFYKGDAYPRGAARIDVMWSASVAETATSLLGLKAPKPRGPPRQHQATESGASKPVDWKLPLAHLNVRMALSFRSNVRFEVIDTLFTYGADDRTTPPAGLRPVAGGRSSKPKRTGLKNPSAM